MMESEEPLTPLEVVRDPEKAFVLGSDASKVQNSDVSDDLAELLDSGSDSANELGSENTFRLLAIDTLKHHQSQEAHIAKLQQWLATETRPRQDEVLRRIFVRWHITSES